VPAAPEIRFTGTLTAARGGGAAIAVDADVRAAFGEARPAVVGTVNGVEYRSRLMVYGGVTYLGLTKAIRDAAGIEIGDEVDVVLRRDDVPRELDLPPELERALNDAGDARHHFDALAFTHRREYARWIGEAKRPETRDRRAARAVELLREGVRRP
jgi:hypothetical protein